MRKKMLTFMLCGVMTASLVGCSNKEKAPETNTNNTATTAPAEETAATASKISIGQVYGAAHGTKCFSMATVVVDGDVIVSAYIDDFQFFGTDAGVTGVPNSDADFASGYADGNVLGSKRVNAEYYSELMASHAGSTVAINANFDAIQSYVAGKTIAEIETLSASDTAVDSVSGATLVDTAGYLNLIAEAAKAAQNNEAVEYTGDLSALTLKVTYGAAHGTKCFTTGAVLTDGNTIVLSYLDDFQFLTNEDGVTGVPNSDADFAAGYAEGVVLASKRVNNAYYSEMMASHAGSTVTIENNYNAIMSHADGMEISAVAVLAAEESPVDAITGATLADTAGYLNLLVEAAQK